MPRRHAPRTLRTLAAALLPLALLALLAVASAQGGVAGTTPLPAFPLERLVPGDRGHGLTEGPGGRIERFEVRVVALQEGLGPAGLDLVLIEARGPVIDAAGGVAAGMSGSPVYLELDGAPALLGAIGYVFPNATGSLALVTPIDAMRRQALGAHAFGGAEGIVPVSTPLLVAGLGARALALLEEVVLRDAMMPFVPIQAGGTSASRTRTDATERVEPGSAVAIGLVRGDVDVAAVGTVTEVDGDRLLALGHAFFGGGPSDWLLASATVTAIVPSRVVPFKLAVIDDRPLGAVVQDRPAGIAAQLGATPGSIDVTLHVDVAGVRDTLRFEVVADETLWPALVAVATLEGLDRVWQRVSSGSARLAWELELEGGPPLRLLDEVSHASDVTLASARMAGAPLALVAGNPFETPRPTSLQLIVELDEGRRDAELVEALLDEGPLRAGASVGLFLRVQPWRRQSEVHSMTVRLPDDLGADTTLVVRGAGEPRDDDHDGSVDGLILSYAELLTVLRERPRRGDLLVEVLGADGRWELLERRSLPHLVHGVERIELSLEASDDTSE